jgi:LysM repeat protein
VARVRRPAGAPDAADLASSEARRGLRAPQVHTLAGGADLADPAAGRRAVGARRIRRPAGDADSVDLASPVIRIRLAAADAAAFSPLADRPGLGAPEVRGRLADLADAGATGRAAAAVPSARALAAPVRLTRLGRVLLGLVAVLISLSVTATAVTLAVRHGRPVPALPASAPAVVVVQPGDTLWGIARRVAPQRDPRDVVTELRQLNALPSADVRAGQQLRLRRP